MNYIIKSNLQNKLLRDIKTFLLSLECFITDEI